MTIISNIIAIVVMTVATLTGPSQSEIPVVNRRQCELRVLDVGTAMWRVVYWRERAELAAVPSHRSSVLARTVEKRNNGKEKKPRPHAHRQAQNPSPAERALSTAG